MTALRLAGVLCFATLGLLLGKAACGDLRRAYKLLSELIPCLLRISDDICSSLIQLPDIFSSLGSRVDGMFSELLESLDGEKPFPDCWSAAVSRRFGGDTLIILLPLGESLGRRDADAQKAAIARAVPLLEREEALLRDRLAHTLPLYKKLGAALCTALAILLL